MTIDMFCFCSICVYVSLKCQSDDQLNFEPDNKSGNLLCCFYVLQVTVCLYFCLFVCSRNYSDAVIVFVTDINYCRQF